jgi:ATP-dependent helicase/nuclease subunit A
LRVTLDFENLNQKQQERWDEFLNELESYSPGVPLPPAIAYLLPKLLEVFPALEAGETGEAILTIYKKQVLRAEACAILERIVRAIVGRELENKLRQTRGIWMVLNQYEQAYSRLVRLRGKLTFYDLQLILGGGENLDQQRLLLTQRPGSRDRLRIDYRLDSRYDHWLLDEFQDTSYLQWSVIENLIDEAVQDQSGQRSLFQVGDLKQAIYAWRGGDVTLFDDIRDHYNRKGEAERIVQRPLNDSWRSGPAVIDLVNTVFGNEPMLRYLLPDSTIDRWRWGTHVSRHPELNGFACVLQPTSDAYGNAADEQADRRLDLMLDILREVDPARRGLSRAVLVQTNKAGQQVVDWIRAHSEIQVISESFVRIAEDNPASAALLDLLQFAAHPGDTFAWQHVMMTPFAKALERPGCTPETLIFEILDDVHRNGFEHLVSTWSQRLEEFVLELDRFSRRRLEMLAEAARGFDSSGSRNISDFIAFAREYAVREPASKGVVQVMTIHKSKGLGFDVVLLPDLDGQALTVMRRGLAVHRNPDRSVKWVMSLPQKAIARADAQLDHYHSEKEAEAAYEGLCTLYVAMTRAKQAMYVIADKTPSRSAPSANYRRLLEKTLGREGEDVVFGSSTALAIFQKGDRDWMGDVHPAEPAGVPTDSQAIEKVHRPPSLERPRYRRKTPSGSESYTLTATQLFSRKGAAARQHGTEVHTLFEQIEWFDRSSKAAVIDYSKAHAITLAAVDETLAALDEPLIAEALTRPAADAQLWREKRFEIVLDGEWLTGTFDRVVFGPGASARILDFKTDKFDGDSLLTDQLKEKAAVYTDQLAIYRKVLARMTLQPSTGEFASSVHRRVRASLLL